MTTSIKLTQSAVKGLPFVQPDDKKRQHLYFDTELKGFGVCVGAKAKTFFVQRDINGKTVRTSIGRYGVYTVDQAREEARELLMKMGKGINPNKEEKPAASVTFADALDLHLKSNKKRSERTLKDYRYLSDQYLSDWLKKPLTEITRKDCRERHRKIGEKNGPYVANSVFRVFRAAYNHALKIHDELGVNPTIAVDWFPEERRKAAIPSTDLTAWYKEVTAMTNNIRRDYLRFVLFTGLRRESAAVVRWEHIDWEKKALLIPRPKGGETRAFLLPLSDFLIDLLKERQKCEQAKTFFPGSPWVFPAESKSGHIAEPKEKLGVKFTVHGLRNTFITVAESLDISPYAIKMLVNHSLPDKQDVTAGYISPELDRLRAPMQEISDRLRLLCEGEKKTQKGQAVSRNAKPKK
ncbi:integrase family protein [Pseudomonas aeruginosa]|nr:integrase family protein [Pseudomonas aeruginosa]